MKQNLKRLSVLTVCLWTVGCYEGVDGDAQEDPGVAAARQLPKIGEHVEVDFTLDAKESLTVREQGAAFLSLHFDALGLALGDALEITDDQGNVVEA